MKSDKYLIVSPTSLEVKYLSKGAIRIDTKSEFYSLPHLRNADLLISGIGISKTTYSLTKILAVKNYDLVIHLGIAGSYDGSLALGSLVNVHSEVFGDLGIQSQKGFTSLFDLSLMDENIFPFTNGKLINKTPVPEYFSKLPYLNSVTVNSLSNSEQVNKERKHMFNAHIEPMEGAAVFYTCLMEKISFIEIRALSNYVGERDKTRWKIDKAVKNLNNIITGFLTSYK